MEESHEVREVRNSGCTLWHNVTVKTGPRAARQAGVMKSVGSVFAPVLFTFEDGYAMPTGTTKLNYHDLRDALVLLEDLWHTPNTAPSITLQQYHDYIGSIFAHPSLHTQAHRYLEMALSEDARPMEIRRVHGDATLENVIKIGDRVCWIDPSERLVPTHAELDIAKVLQSLLGYEKPMHGPQADVAWDWIYKHTRRGGRASVPLVLYYYITHLIRLWPLQYLKRDWALSTIGNVESYL